jgi:hypothetical protein
VRARSAGVVTSALVLCLAGCANLWGFSDFTLGDAGEDSGDATMLEGSADASLDSTRETAIGDDRSLAEDRGSEAGFDTAGGSDAVAADAVTEAAGDCGATNTAVNCGACGVACIGTNASMAGCEDGSCVYSCTQGWGDCDAAAPNAEGCKTPLTTPANCAGCGQACDTNHSNGASCSGGTCTYTSCMLGWADCDAAPPDTNGCETPVAASATCGACGETCDTDSGHSLGATCDGGTCSYTGCAPGWADCNKTPPDTHGCNTSLSSVLNCGMCGRACDSTWGTPSCDGEACSYVCNVGRANCNTTPPNIDGCECATPGCCDGGVCQTTHSNGVSGGVAQSFYDCIARGTYDQVQAGKACAAFTGTSTQCTVSTASLCLGGLLGGQGVSASSVCSSGAATCYCWQYSGPNQGKVQTITGACTATCGGSGSDPQWN